ncbi:MAG TPA: hypothetical protein VGA61_00075 [Anaerolineae bacterium]
MAEFRNQQTSVTALGLAINGSAYYASLTGPRNAVKSIWASLTGKNARAYVSEWHWRNFRFAETTRQFWQPLPNTAWHHAVFVVGAPNLLIVVDPGGAALDPWKDTAGRQELLARRRPELLVHFTGYLNEASEAPLLPEWGEALWEFGLKNWREVGAAAPGLAPLDCYGDCLGAWLISLEFPWVEATQALLRSRRIAWPG